MKPFLAIKENFMGFTKETFTIKETLSLDSLLKLE